MKLAKNTAFKVRTAEQYKKYSYNIKSEQLGMVLEILRGMYENSIAAIAREITSNARDAHIEAGCPEKPIRVSINDNPWQAGQNVIIIEDEGVGISPERMGDVFVNYGASTKRDNNEEAGGFGIGAKTPFSYTDSFYVTTRVDGKEYTYVTNVEEEETGEMHLFEMSETDKPNGTQIIVPMEENDREKFEWEIYKATGFWKVQPEYTNFKTKFSRKIINTVNDVEIIENEWDRGDGYNRTMVSGTNLLIGDVAYPMPNKSLFKLTFPDSDCPVFIRFNVGELKLVPNRERVKDTNVNIEKITAKLENFLNYYEGKLEEHMNSFSTYWKACVEARNLNANSGDKTSIAYINEILNLGSRQTFKYHGEELKTKLSAFKRYTFTLKREGFKKAVELNVIDGNFNEYPLVHMDCARFSAQRDRTLFDGSKGFIVVKAVDNALDIFSDTDYANKRRLAKNVRLSLRNWKSMEEKYGFLISNYSDVEKTKVAKGTSVKNTYKAIKCRVHTGRSPEAEVVKIEDGVYTFSDDDVMDTSSHLVHFVGSIKDLYHVSHYYGERTERLAHNRIEFMIDRVVEADYTVVIIPERFKSNFLNFRTLESAMNETSIVNKIKEMVFDRTVRDYGNKNKVHRYANLKFADGQHLKLKPCSDLLKKGDSNGGYYNIPSDLFAKYEAGIESDLQEASMTIAEIEKEYPLLDCYDSGHKKSFQEYITMKEMIGQDMAEAEAEEEVGED